MPVLNSAEAGEFVGNLGLPHILQKEDNTAQWQSQSCILPDPL